MSNNTPTSHTVSYTDTCKSEVQATSPNEAINIAKYYGDIPQECNRVNRVWHAEAIE